MPLVEGATERFFGFKHRGAMEYYCALHLVDNVEPGWVRRPAPEAVAAGETPLRCGDAKLAGVAADRNWYWVFRFAIELASPVSAATSPRERLPARVVPNAEKTLASLAELLLPRGQGGGRRPTELIYRAWHLFEFDPLVLRERGLTMEQGRGLILPGAEQVVAYYRRAAEHSPAIEALKRSGFTRCPKNPEDDGKPFPMGSPEGEGNGDEHPRHAVTVQPFRMQATPITRSQYRVFDPEWERVESDKLREYSPEADCPASNVSWYDAFAFAKWLGSGCRLPTEAEWEYACRAGSETRYCFGDSDIEFDEYAWYYGNSGDSTHPVGRKRPNAWELYDMHGNVVEWCSDWFDDAYYGRSPANDPAGPETGSSRVDRGGGWHNFARNCRSASRDRSSPDIRDYALGFRLALVPADESSK